MTFLLADPTQIVISLVFLAVSLATSYYLSSQAAKAARKANNEFFEPSQVTQGARIHWLHGSARIPVIVGWVGRRLRVMRRSSGSKGKKEKSGPYWYEDAWHQVCIGPGVSIKRIWSDESLIWDYTKGIRIIGIPGQIATPDGITPAIAPSGTRVVIAYTQVGVRVLDSYTFTVMWGDDDQALVSGTPIFSSAAAETGIASRFPRVLGMYWHGFPLGSAPRWPQIDVEAEAYGVFSGGSDPCSTDTVTVTGDDGDVITPPEDPLTVSTVGTGTETLTSVLTYAIVDEGWYRFGFEDFDLRLDLFGTGTGNFFGQTLLSELSDGSETITVLNEGVPDLSGVTMADPVIVGCWTGEYDGGRERYRRDPARRFVYLTPGTWTLTTTVGVVLAGASAGRAEMSFGDFTGCTLTEIENPVVTPVGGVSFLRRLLFGRFPQGLGLPESSFDTDSIDTVEEELADEGLVTSVVTKDESASQILGAWLADMGVAFYWDQEIGKHRFRRIRAETTATVVEADHQTETLPQVEVYHGPIQADAIAYSFRDPDREYKPTVLPQADDGHADEQGMTQAKQVDLSTVGDFATAGKVAQRRQQEDLGNAVAYTFKLTRAAALLKPGQLIRMEQSFEVSPYLRVISVQRDDSSNVTVIKAAVDSYAVPHVDYAGEDGGGTSAPFDEAEIDVSFTFLEIPDDLARVAGFPRPMIGVLRGRASDGITYADLLISDDGTNYDNVDRTETTMFAGELAADWDDTGWILVEGPEITSLGVPDLDGLQDLSSDQATWRRGTQVMVVGEEITYIQKLTPVTAPDLWRADGVIRARFDTRRAAHATGTKVFIFTLADVALLQDARIAPGVELSLKTQPGTPNDVVDLADVTAETKTLLGKGVVPQRVASLREVRGIRSYHTGQDVTLAWGYRNPVTSGSGAGHQGYGLPTNEDPVRGTFEVRVYDDTDALVRTESAGTALTWTYDNADLVTDLGGETDFRVEVRNIDGGLRSEPAEINITFI